MAELTPCPEDGSAPPRSRRELAAITVGATASSAHRLEDLDGNDAVFFAFPDISVRVEGVFRLKVTLYEWVGTKMVRIAAVQTNSFTIYRPKKFPGLEESTALSRHLSEQGVKIRLRQ
ncbi:velvet factor, partial [Blastocladiella britannica]